MTPGVGPGGPAAGATSETTADPTSATKTPIRDRAAKRAWTWLDRLSLRAKLVGIVFIVLCIGLAGSAAISLGFLRTYLVDQVDRELSADFNQVVSLAVASCQAADEVAIPADYYWSIRTPEGDTICESNDSPFTRTDDVPKLPDTEKSLAASGGPAADGGRQSLDIVQVGSVSGGTSWRVASVASASGSFVVSVAYPMTQVDGIEARVRWLLLWGAGTVILAGSALGYFAVRRSLRPLTDVERTAAAIADGDLSQRVPSLPESTEVGHLAQALNDMLAQIEEAFAVQAASEERMRRFVSDASHELRTPLSVLRGFGELYRMGAIPAEEIAPTMRRIEDESKRLGVLVEDLLALARLDERRPMTPAAVDLTAVAADAAADARALAPERRVTVAAFDDGPVGPVDAWADEAGVRQVVANLMGNAVNHTPSGTPVEILVGIPSMLPAPLAERGRPYAAIAIRDHGKGIDPAEAAKVFERFYRTDASRQRGKGGGSGLGLAIVQSIVAALDGRIDVAQTDGGGATMTVYLPATPVRTPADDAAAGEARLGDRGLATGDEGLGARDPDERWLLDERSDSIDD